MPPAENQICNASSPHLPADTEKKFTVRVRAPGGAWEPVSVFNARVGLRRLGRVSVAAFDFSGTAEVQVAWTGGPQDAVRIRPDHAGVAFTRPAATAVQFPLTRPVKLSIEVNGDTLHNLHLFANAMEVRTPQPGEDGVLHYGPGIHRVPGDGRLRLASGQTLYLAHGAVLKTRGILVDHAENVRVCGRGLVDLSDHLAQDPFDKTRENTRGVSITFSHGVSVEGVTFLNPNHYTVYAGQSRGLRLTNLKSFSSALWGDGIDCMSVADVEIADVFLRTSDDCIAIYGHRWNFFGDTRNVTVRDAVLWADVAHPVLIGTHGWHEANGDVIENITMEDVDVLLHDETIPEYHGVIAVNAGDENVVRNLTFADIRVAEIRDGQLVNLRVFRNEAYNPKPGRRIENVTIRNLSYDGAPKLSEISGYAPDRPVRGVRFENLRINGTLILSPAAGGIRIGDHAGDVAFAAGLPA